MTSNNIYLPLQPQQLFDLVKQLPATEKQQLLDLLQHEQLNHANEMIPEPHKTIVRERIKKYNLHPQLSISEDEAMLTINNM